MRSQSKPNRLDRTENRRQPESMRMRACVVECRRKFLYNDCVPTLDYLRSGVTQQRALDNSRRTISRHPFLSKTTDNVVLLSRYAVAPSCPYRFRADETIETAIGRTQRNGTRCCLYTFSRSARSVSSRNAFSFERIMRIREKGFKRMYRFERKSRCKGQKRK